MKLTEGLLDLLFPPKCPFCRRILERLGACPSCEDALVENHFRQDADGFCCAGALGYGGSARQALLRLKFQGDAAVAEPLGRLLAQCADLHFHGEFDVVTWVPVSAKRLRTRGYDQAELLAKSVCGQWGMKPVRLLQKKIHNPAQSSISDAAARQANVTDVYEASDAAAGKRILLIDDICTTGATLKECASTLYAAGAKDVLCLAAALGEQLEPEYSEPHS